MRNLLARLEVIVPSEQTLVWVWFLLTGVCLLVSIFSIANIAREYQRSWEWLDEFSARDKNDLE